MVGRFLLSRKGRGEGHLPALCRGWARAGFDGVELLMQHNLGTCWWDGIHTNGREVVTKPKYDQYLAVMLASSFFMLQAFVGSMSI